MPELPDIVVYITALERLLTGQKILGIDLKSPFLVRSINHESSACVGKRIRGFQRLGKRIIWELESDWFLVFHLMFAGRYHWKSKLVKPRGKIDLAAFQFEHGTMMLTEASSKKRAALHVVHGKRELAEHNPGGLEILNCTLEEFQRSLCAENHTLKRALTNPRSFSGIGNAYSDEILFHAGLSPVKWTSRLSSEEIERLYESVRETIKLWIERLAIETGETFPEKVTAFREQMAVHGKYRKPCPNCQTAIQRIVYAENETNYCPKCQTAGKLLADRSLSRLLKDDWPKSIDQWEQP